MPSAFKVANCRCEVVSAGRKINGIFAGTSLELQNLAPYSKLASRYRN